MSTVPDPGDHIRTLAKVRLFSHLDERELGALAELLQPVEFTAGQPIFHTNDKGDALYVVRSGRVRIWIRDDDLTEVTLAELTDDEMFGEMAVLDGGPRSASATAVEATSVHRLSRTDFEAFLLRCPHAALDIIRELTGRLRLTNQLVTQRAARNVNAEMDEKLSFGDYVADRVASFGGSWPFIFLYVGFLILWMVVNSIFLARIGRAPDGSQFDPYPYILLNLMLSMTAALQAPIIMMSQNRAGKKDRLVAENDYKVNLKSEMMLEDLVRREREHAARIDALLEAIRELQTAGSKPERS